MIIIQYASLEQQWYMSEQSSKTIEELLKRQADHFLEFDGWCIDQAAFGLDLCIFLFYTEQFLWLFLKSHSNKMTRRQRWSSVLENYQPINKCDK